MSGNDNLDDSASSWPASASGDEDEPRVRRTSGARNPISESVAFRHGERQIDGWCLNISRGGLRAIIEDTVEVGDEFEVAIGDSTESRRSVVVWVRQEKDGAIVGVSFCDIEGSVPPPPAVPPAAGSPDD